MTSLMKESKSIMTNKMNKRVFVTKKFINVEMCYTEPLYVLSVALVDR